LDINIAGEQAHWIKYKTWFYKKVKKKTEKAPIKIEDFKVHHWQYSGWNSQ